MTDDQKTLASAERRNFLKLSAAGGFTAALVAGAAGTLWSTEAAAQTANEEREREQAAEHVMTIATAYVLGASRSYPIMQLDLKENIVEENGFKALFYVNIDPRVVAVRKGGAGAVLSPSDLDGVKFRVPGSKMLQQYYRMVGANPTPVAWGETPSAIKQGVADALDPSVGALYVFGFKDILSHVTFTQAVPDSQVYSCNLEWFNSMPADVQEGIMWGSEMTAHQNLSKVPSARAYAMSELAKSGVEFHSLSDDQLGEWQAAGGYQRPEWDEFKVELAGSMDNFAKMEEAAGTQGKYYVHDA